MSVWCSRFIIPCVSVMFQNLPILCIPFVSIFPVAASSVRRVVITVQCTWRYRQLAGTLASLYNVDTRTLFFSLEKKNKCQHLFGENCLNNRLIGCVPSVYCFVLEIVHFDLMLLKSVAIIKKRSQVEWRHDTHQNDTQPNNAQRNLMARHDRRKI